MTLSPETLAWLRGLVDGLTIKVGSPDFEQAAALAAKAKSELDAALEESKSESSSPAAP